MQNPRMTSVNGNGLPWSGEINAVSGRRAAPATCGLPALQEVHLQLSDGTALDFTSPASGQEGKLDLVEAILPMSFARVGAPWTPVCPICLSECPRTKEHVPQGGLGGIEMTTTCKRCNNELGSRFERELQDWFDGALVDVKFEHPDVRGARRGPRIYVMDSDAGFGLFPDAELAAEVEAMLRAGTFQLHYRAPDPQRFRIALLKHAYLAACLYLGYVPDIDEAVAIREVLVAMRDAPRRGRPPAEPLAERLAVYRSGRPAAGPHLAIMKTQPAEVAGGVPPYLISLAGSLFVSWPFSVVPRRRAPGLVVGLISDD
jgi:hypothetical protein